MKNLLINLVEKNKKYTDEGKLASYIPALLKANKEDLGLCIYDIKNKDDYEKCYKSKNTIHKGTSLF